MKFSHWIFKLPLIHRFDAICVGRWVLFKAPQERVSPTLIVHELVHQRQMNQHGVLGFYLIYVWDFLRMLVKHRRWMQAYYSIPFEIEAYGS